MQSQVLTKHHQAINGQILASEGH